MAKPFATVGDLVKFALVCAIRDRETYADCDPGPDGREAQAEADAFRAYLRRRYGVRPATDRIDEAKSVSLTELRAQYEPKE